MLENYPIWVQLKNLHLVLWNTRGISKLANLIGKRIDINETTRQVKLLNYACVFVELKANHILHKSFHAKDKQGKFYIQEVEYKFIPP